MDELLLASARRGNKRAGQRDLINHLQGKRLTQRQAIKAHCYDCQGMGEDPICDNDECSLSPYSPYFKGIKATRARASGVGVSGCNDPAEQS